MKSKVINCKNENVFMPFTIEITAENMDELKRLWHLFNQNTPFTSSDKYPYNSKNADTDDIWGHINNELKKY